jgi:ribonuclease P protein component
MRLAPGSAQRPGRGRLSRSAEFDRVFRQGRSHSGRDLVLYVFPRGTEDESPRLGLSVSRKVGGAVERNRVKRLLREAFAREAARLPAGSDAVVIARQGAKDLAEREGLAGIRRALAELVDRVPGVVPSAEVVAGAPDSLLGSDAAADDAAVPLGADLVAGGPGALVGCDVVVGDPDASSSPTEDVAS